MTEQASLPLAELELPAGIRSRLVDNVNGLTMHVLEAGYESAGRPCVLLLHGFPEIAYTWHKVMPRLAAAGFHVVAPDQRGYGRTTGWDRRYDGDVGSFRLLNLVKDLLALIDALGFRSVDAVVGHDFGSPVAGYCALIRPDVFRSVVLMSAPFAGPPPLGDPIPAVDPIYDALAKLDPPRKHYQDYYAQRDANADMHDSLQGIHAFLRAYYHYKSADWKGNDPFELKAWTAEELAKLPGYYVMNLNEGMAQTVAREMPSLHEIATCEWLPEHVLSIYSEEFRRTGFQGGLQWYRCMLDAQFKAELQIFDGRTIDVPSCFIAGLNDWGIRQKPGELERMQRQACTQMIAVHLIAGAGHWVQQEQPDETADKLLRFIQRNTS